MLRDIDQYYLNKEEPTKSCLIAVREFILSHHADMSEAWRYRMPFFLYQNKRICYLWTDKKSKEPYLGIVDGNQLEHPLLEQGNRSRMKIFRINPSEDLPLETLDTLLNAMIHLIDQRS
ncbi:MAG: DUF1801 domain-containing protein [Flammeovirgaceae bacterium]